MRIERPNLPSPGGGVDRLRSNLSSIVSKNTKKKIHTRDSYDLSYRKPLLSSDEYSGKSMHCYQYSQEDYNEEDELDDDYVTPLSYPGLGGHREGGKYGWKKKAFSPRSTGSTTASKLLSPRTTRTSTSISSPGSTTLKVSQPTVKKVLNAVSNLRSPKNIIIGTANAGGKNYGYNDNDDDDVESRDDDSQYLLRSALDLRSNDAGRQHFAFIQEESDEYAANGNTGGEQQQQQQQPMKQQHRSFKQLNTYTSSDDNLEVVDFGGFDSSGGTTTTTTTTTNISSSSNNELNEILPTSNEEQQQQLNTNTYYQRSDSSGSNKSSSSEKENNNDEVVIQPESNNMEGVKRLVDQVHAQTVRMSSTSSSTADHQRSTSASKNSIRSTEEEEKRKYSLAGLEISQLSSQFSQFTSNSSASAFGRTSTVSSTFGYSADTVEDCEERSLASNSNSNASSSSDSNTIDLDSHLTVEDVIAGAPLISPVDGLMKTPLEDSIADTEDGQRSYVTYATYATQKHQHPYPVAVTPTENGDVILITPIMDDVVDIGLQRDLKKNDTSKTRAAADVGGNGPKAALLIPTLGEGNLLQDVKINLVPALSKDDSSTTDIDHYHHEQPPVDASQIKSVRNKRIAFWEVSSSGPAVDNTDASPTGVDELADASEDEFSDVGFNTTTVQRRGSQINMLELPYKPTSLPPTTTTAATCEESSEFIATDDWDTEAADSYSYSSKSNPFGTCTVHEDVLHDFLLKDSRDDSAVIQLRPSLESDCCATTSSVVSSSSIAHIQLRPSLESDCCATTSSVVSSSIAQTLSDFSETTAKLTNKTIASACLLDDVTDITTVDEERSKSSKDSKESTESRSESKRSHNTNNVSLGSFNQIFQRSDSVPDDVEDSDSESDAPGDYFDYSHEVDSVAEEQTSDFMNDLINQKSVLKSNRPWAKDKDDDSHSEYCELDLISNPSRSFSQGEEEAQTSVPRELSRESVQSANVAATDSDEEAASDEGMKDFDKLNNYWVHEWKELSDVKDVVDEAKEMTDPDYGNQPRFLLKNEVGDAMNDDKMVGEVERSSDLADGSEKEESPTAEENICKDCDRNTYLRIYDLDSGVDTYEVLETSHSLEAVKECSSAEEEEEDGDNRQENEVEVAPHQQPSTLDESTRSEPTEMTELSNLWNRIDDYQKSVKHEMPVASKADNTIEDTTPCPDDKVEKGVEKTIPCTINEEKKDVVETSTFKYHFGQYRSVKSTKKMHVHIKKRAITKARAERAKYSLAYLELGSHHEKGSHCHDATSGESVERPRSHSDMSHLSLDVSLDGILAKAFDALSDFEDENDALKVEASNAVAILKAKRDSLKKVESALLSESQCSSLSGSLSESVSSDSSDLLSWDMNEESSPPQSVANKTSEESEKDEATDLPSYQQSAGQPDELKKSMSVIASKLYHENSDLAETLAQTQSELEKVTRKLERVTAERDDILSTARFEI